MRITLKQQCPRTHLHRTYSASGGNFGKAVFCVQGRHVAVGGTRRHCPPSEQFEMVFHPLKEPVAWRFMKFASSLKSDIKNSHLERSKTLTIPQSPRGGIVEVDRGRESVPERKLLGTENL